MNLFTQNSPYYHLLKYLQFLLKHPVYTYIFLICNIGHNSYCYHSPRVPKSLATPPFQALKVRNTNVVPVSQVRASAMSLETAGEKLQTRPTAPWQARKIAFFFFGNKAVQNRNEQETAKVT